MSRSFTPQGECYNGINSTDTINTMNTTNTTNTINTTKCQSRLNDRSRLRSFADAGGKSGLLRAGCSVTRSRGNAKESATEKIPPCEMAATPISRGKGEKVR